MILPIRHTRFGKRVQYRHMMIGMVTALCMILGAGCSGQKGPPPKPREVPVTAATAATRSMPVAIEAVGTVEAYNSVQIISRVTGQLMEIHFKEGQDVAKGALLMTIDPLPFREKLRAAQAQLARDKSAYEFKKAESDRHNVLIKEGAVSKSEHERYRSDEEAQLSVIRADEAELEQARLNLSYCTIRAPIAGRTGAFLLRQGSIIEANRTSLVVVNQIRPIFVRFAIPEKYLADVKKYLAAGTLRTSAQIAGSNVSSAAGKVTFIDNAVDPKTGMIYLKAEFPNKGLTFWPGQFVTVQMVLTTQSNAVVIPAQAVQTGQKGTYVFIVDKNRTVQLRPVTVDRLHGQEAVISQGVVAGETVVTNGQNKLQNGFIAVIKSSLEGTPPK